MILSEDIWAQLTFESSGFSSRWIKTAKFCRFSTENPLRCWVNGPFTLMLPKSGGLTKIGTLDHTQVALAAEWALGSFDEHHGFFHLSGRLGQTGARLVLHHEVQEARLAEGKRPTGGDQEQRETSRSHGAASGRVACGKRDKNVTGTELGPLVPQRGKWHNMALTSRHGDIRNGRDPAIPMIYGT